MIDLIAIQLCQQAVELSPVRGSVWVRHSA